MKLYLCASDFRVTPIDYNKDLILRSNNDQIIDLFIGDEDNAPMVLSGCIVYFIVKDKPTDLDTSAKINKYYTSDTFPFPQNGEAAITLRKSDCATLVGNYVYQILIKFDYLSGVPLKVLSEGTITFQKNIQGSLTSGTAGQAPYTTNPD